MTSQYLNARQTESSLSFPQEFKEHLEDLVYEILKEKPNDPLEYAFNFFSKKLKTREGMKLKVCVEILVQFKIYCICVMCYCHNTTAKHTNYI
jgi:predicted transcriptional regulator